MEKINLSEAYIDGDIKKAVMDVLDSGRYIRGENLQKFEQEFAEFCSAKHAVGTSSGTAALLLSLLALGISRGDEVIVPSHTFIATASPVLFLQAAPVFVDINPETYTIDAGRIEENITKKTRAIIPVHLYGHPADMDAINEIAEEHNLHIIEDACQAHGALYRDKKVGAIGDCAAFSFFPSKNMTVCGDGGMVVTDNEELAEKIAMLRDHGRREKYAHELLGLNFRLSEIHSAIGRQQLKHLPEWIEKRRTLASYYNRLLDGVEGIRTPAEKSWARHVYHLYVIRSSQRDVLMKYLNEGGISTGIHYPIPVHRQPCMHGIAKSKLPDTEACAKEILSLPMHPGLTEDKVKYIADKIKAFMRQ